jgi:hypothetical protein
MHTQLAKPRFLTAALSMVFPSGVTALVQSTRPLHSAKLAAYSGANREQRLLARPYKPHEVAGG